jgi:hypothetical protein
LSLQDSPNKMAKHSHIALLGLLLALVAISDSVATASQQASGLTATVDELAMPHTQSIKSLGRKLLQGTDTSASTDTGNDNGSNNSQDTQDDDRGGTSSGFVGGAAGSAAGQGCETTGGVSNQICNEAGLASAPGPAPGPAPAPAPEMSMMD